jgi:hypothetical protein
MVTLKPMESAMRMITAAGLVAACWVTTCGMLASTPARAEPFQGQRAGALPLIWRPTRMPANSRRSLPVTQGGTASSGIPAASRSPAAAPYGAYDRPARALLSRPDSTSAARSGSCPANLPHCSALGLALGLLVAPAAAHARAVDLPTRKAGLWEMKLRTGLRCPR